MGITFSDLEDCFLYVSCAPWGMCEAYVDRRTGATYLGGDAAEDEAPDDLDTGHWVAVPHKNDLGLGNRLVFDFAATLGDEDQEKIEAFFRSRGAYRRFKDYLDRIGELERWYRFENDARREAILTWARENHVAIDDVPEEARQPGDDPAPSDSTDPSVCVDRDAFSNYCHAMADLWKRDGGQWDAQSIGDFLRKLGDQIGAYRVTGSDREFVLNHDDCDWRKLAYAISECCLYDLDES